ncbi:conserved hypothetical protein [Desulfonispora thiosulfatigenes DSM 11270]|uniref:Uncharacterized protein n=1 Tax=Desulfonispora thiosulfatigenes DSM 11270 TaxID=656914 RepID=A0A1W1VEY4_DESTI|nr:hypothetical protein [Desulfonispora thiosulfatigenes]SMB91783.1 conserved hypothetical protein [Desulfonispora thiosulfatigenes DSM 11270]
MIILEKPYVSELLINSLIEDNIPVLKNAVLEEMAEKNKLKVLAEQEFKNRITVDTKLYSNSENALGWIAANLPDYYEEKK